MLVIQASSHSSLWDLLLCVPLRNNQGSEGVANVRSSFKFIPLCSHASITMEWSESPLTIKEHMHALTYTRVHLFSFDATVPAIGPGGGKGAFRVSGIQLWKLSTVKQLRMRLHFCIPSEMGILCNLSAFALTVQVMWSTCPQPSSWNRSTGNREESLLIHRGCGGQAFPSQGIKATFIEIYREPCCNRFQLQHMASANHMVLVGKLNVSLFRSSPR